MKTKTRKNQIKKHLVIIIVFMIILLLLVISLFLSIFYQKQASLIQLSNESNSSFTIIVLPDTQYYSELYPKIFINQTKWIVENKQSLNIQMVIHEGDIVFNNNNKPEKWDTANQSFSILEQANIPYSLIPGNHDTNTKTNYNNYDLYFPKTRFENKSWFGGSFGNYRNNYQLLNINNKTYLFISLELCPNKSVINWANQILNNYPNFQAILTTHGYLSASEPTKRYVYSCGSTEYIWNDLIKLHPNLQLVLSGHIHSEKRRTDNNQAAKPVYQILADYQDEKLGGSGYLRIMQWDQEKNIINIQTYSPYLNRYKKGYDSEFSIRL